MEEELIFKFLDSHVGDGIVCKKLRTRMYGTMYKTWNNGAYAVLSDNGTMILWFQHRDDMLKIYYSFYGFDVIPMPMESKNLSFEEIVKILHAIAKFHADTISNGDLNKSSWAEIFSWAKILKSANISCIPIFDNGWH